MLSDRYRLSHHTAEMDRARIHAWLSDESYWARGRSRATQDAAIDGSLNFGIFDSSDGRQVAYARVVTDSVTFAWLCDVFVDPAFRGERLGVQLIDGVMAHLEPLGLKRTLLVTGDAHALYSRFGFEPLDAPERFMVKLNPSPSPGPTATSKSTTT